MIRQNAFGGGHGSLRTPKPALCPENPGKNGFHGALALLVSSLLRCKRRAHHFDSRESQLLLFPPVTASQLCQPFRGKADATGQAAKTPISCFCIDSLQYGHLTDFSRKKNQFECRAKGGARNMATQTNIRSKQTNVAEKVMFNMQRGNTSRVLTRVEPAPSSNMFQVWQALLSIELAGAQQGMRE